MSYLSIFRTNENQKQKWDSIIYEISEFVSAFFWDEAPDKYGLEAREGQQEWRLQFWTPSAEITTSQLKLV